MVLATSPRRESNERSCSCAIECVVEDRRACSFARMRSSSERPVTGAAGGAGVGYTCAEGWGAARGGSWARGIGGMDSRAKSGCQRMRRCVMGERIGEPSTRLCVEGGGVDGSVRAPRGLVGGGISSIDGAMRGAWPSLERDADGVSRPVWPARLVGVTGSIIARVRAVCEAGTSESRQSSSDKWCVSIHCAWAAATTCVSRYTSSRRRSSMPAFHIARWLMFSRRVGEGGGDAGVGLAAPFRGDPYCTCSGAVGARCRAISMPMAQSYVLRRVCTSMLRVRVTRKPIPPVSSVVSLGMPGACDHIQTRRRKSLMSKVRRHVRSTIIRSR